METKFIAHGYKYPVTIKEDGNRLWFIFNYNKTLIEQIRLMEGARYHGFDDPPVKQWTVTNSLRNWFQIARLEGKNPYHLYDKPLLEHTPRRQGLWSHQLNNIRHGITRQYCIIAAEPALGKTLSVIEIIEWLYFNRNIRSWFFAGPKSALISVKQEFEEWKSLVYPQFFSYEALKSIIENWPKNTPPPQGIVFDEMQRLKNPTSQRSIAAKHLSESIRKEWGEKGAVIGLTGTPAPNNPGDWWNLAEVTCVPKDTWIFTENGPKQVKELCQQPVKIYVNSELFESKTGFFYSGNKQVFEICTKKGYSFKATANHKVLCDYFGITSWQEVKDLTIGTQIKLNKHNNIYWDGEGTYEEGYLIGLLIGDGNIKQRRKEVTASLYFYGDDYLLIPFVIKAFPEPQNILAKNTNDFYVEGGYLNLLSRKYNLKPEKYINNLIENNSKEFLSGFLSGFFDSDGSVTYDSGSVVISLAQSDLFRLKTVQRMLLYFNIVSKIRKIHGSKEYKINNKVGMRKEMFDLRIHKENVENFQKYINFNHPRKFNRLKELIERKPNKFKEETYVDEIKEIITLGNEDVYDITVPKINAFSGNGFILHNCPGFILEGDLNKFRKRLAVLDEGKSDSGQTFLSLKGWRDSDSKCAICGQLESEPNHDEINATEKSYHTFQKGVNEVSKLYERLKGLVVVNLKKDCLDLPDKIFKIIECKPTQSVINAAKLITAHAYSVIQTMTLLRELSDGFQYQKVESGTETCPICEGSKIQDDWIYKGPEEDYEKFLELQANGQEIPSHYFEKITIACRHCDGTGESIRYGREVAEVPCPKEDRLIDLIDEYEDVGRMVTYAGFTGSVDRAVKAYLKMNWEVIRVDGRGWWSSMPGKAAELYKKFKYDKINHPRIGFVAHPMSGGTGLNLQVAPVAIFYSNDFNGESRQQSIERIHRPGMDVNRGATIIDLIHLPTDKLVLDNLEKKRKLQSLTLGDFKDILNG